MKRRTPIAKAASQVASTDKTPIYQGPVTPGKLVKLMNAVGITWKMIDDIEDRQLDQVVVNGGLAYITNGHFAVRAQVGDPEACEWVKSFQMPTLVDSVTGAGDITQGLPATEGFPAKFPKIESVLMSKPDIESPDRKTVCIDPAYLMAVAKLAQDFGWKSVEIGIINDTSTATFSRYEFDADKKEIKDLVVIMPIRK